MGKQKFNIQWRVNAIIEIDDEVINSIDDDWRSHFYNLHTPESIASHVGYNLVLNHVRLCDMDGFADQQRSNAKVIESEIILDETSKIEDE